MSYGDTAEVDAVDLTDYLPCIHCLAFSDELWRHCRTCHLRKQVNDEKSTGVLAKARMLLEGGLQEEGNITDKGMQDLHMSQSLILG